MASSSMSSSTSSNYCRTRSSQRPAIRRWVCDAVCRLPLLLLGIGQHAALLPALQYEQTAMLRRTHVKTVCHAGGAARLQDTGRSQWPRGTWASPTPLPRLPTLITPG